MGGHLFHTVGFIKGGTIVDFHSFNSTYNFKWRSELMEWCSAFNILNLSCAQSWTYWSYTWWSWSGIYRWRKKGVYLHTAVRCWVTSTRIFWCDPFMVGQYLNGLDQLICMEVKYRHSCGLKHVCDLPVIAKV